MSWWTRLKERLGRATAAAPTQSQRARWIPPDQSPFDVPVLDLIAVTGQLLAASSNLMHAQRASSWRGSIGDELDASALDAVAPIACALRYPRDPLLPADGLLYTPTEMEHKWALALRGDRLLAARSWTGEVVIVGDARRTDDALVIEALRIRADAGLDALGDPIQLVDWMIRSHALGQRLPVPVSEAGAALLEGAPTTIFSYFGHIALCAATSWSPGPPARPLRVDGRVMLAARSDDLDALRELAARGESLDTPSPTEGFTPLLLATIRGDAPLMRLLLELGADPRRADDRGVSPLARAIAHAPREELLELLLAAGADLEAVTADGFTLLHVAAENNRSALVPWLVSRGASLEARTHHGHTPLHIACALGHIEAARALLVAGADIDARGPGGESVEDIATSQGKQPVAAYVARWRERGGDA